MELKQALAAPTLEHVGDRATNIAERVAFMASGHMQELNPESFDTTDIE